MHQAPAQSISIAPAHSRYRPADQPAEIDQHLTKQFIQAHKDSIHLPKHHGDHKHNKLDQLNNSTLEPYSPVACSTKQAILKLSLMK